MAVLIKHIQMNIRLSVQIRIECNLIEELRVVLRNILSCLSALNQFIIDESIVCIFSKSINDFSNNFIIFVSLS